MKQTIILILTFFILQCLNAQYFEVRDFKYDPSDLAAIRNERTNINDEKCAIIKVRSNIDGLQFDSNLGITEIEYKTGEVWLYVSPGERALKFMRTGIVTMDYNIPTGIRIEPSRVYILELVATVAETPPAEIESQWLLITAEPNTSLIYLNDAFEATGLLQKRLLPGTYTYRVENNLYHTQAGRITITADKRAELNVNLKPNFGFIEVKSTPEAGARVLIDGNDAGFTTNGTSQRLKSGNYTVTVIKEQFQPVSRQVTVNDNETNFLTLNLAPNFATVEVKLPSDATLFINNERRGSGNWSGRLNAGVYTFEARKDKHRPIKQDLQLEVGDSRTIELEPQPITGSLDVVTNPPIASIKLNGKDYGTTPNTIRNLLIGEYTLALEKQGYTSVSKSITVTEDGSTLLNETMSADLQATIINEQGSDYYDSVAGSNQLEQSENRKPVSNEILTQPDTPTKTTRETTLPVPGGLEDLEHQAPMSVFNPYENLILRALDFYRKNDFPSTLRELNMAIQYDPEHPRAYYYRGQIYVDLNNFKEAKKDFLKVTSAIEDDHRVWNFLGATQTHEGDNESAVESYNEAIALDPENALYYFNRGSSLGQLGKLQEALTDFNKSVELGMNTSGIFNNRANSRYMLGDFQGAIADFTRSMELDPESMAPYANRGIAYLYMRDTLRACVDWQRALQMGHPLVKEYLERYCK